MTTKLTKEQFNELATAAITATGWTPEPQGERYDLRMAGVKDGMRFCVTYVPHTHRLHIQTWTWPGYTTAELREHPDTKQVWPRDLREPKESDPDITVSADKTPEQIARDISRRFLAEYTRIYTRCRAVADERQAGENASRDGWAQVCRVLKADPKRNTHYADIAGSYNATIENRSGKAYVSLYLTADQLTTVMEALKS
jgi:hypothetical protein